MAFPFSIVIPTYNEAGGIETLLRALDGVFRANRLDGEIIVVDDNSPDGTGAIVDRLAQTLPVRCLHRPGKLGLSTGVIDGWKVARKESVALGAMDADFSHDINALPKMVEALASGRYGLAVGSRYVAGGGIANWPRRRIITSRVACWLARPLTSVKDVTSGYFLVRREALEGVDLDPIGFKIGLEVIAKGALRQRARDAVRLHRSRRRRIETQPKRDLQLSQTAAQAVRGAAASARSPAHVWRP